mmetsp:Transcript_6005/g.16650  ORF Transcript_6005/g.16650 Transcript_6005/m.16650 type:complete len:297 (-) Transcript_6005:433-1323(-)
MMKTPLPTSKTVEKGKGLEAQLAVTLGMARPNVKLVIPLCFALPILLTKRSVNCLDKGLPPTRTTCAPGGIPSSFACEPGPILSALHSLSKKTPKGLDKSILKFDSRCNNARPSWVDRAGSWVRARLAPGPCASASSPLSGTSGPLSGGTLSPAGVGARKTILAGNGVSFKQVCTSALLKLSTFSPEIEIKAHPTATPFFSAAPRAKLTAKTSAVSSLSTAKPKGRPSNTASKVGNTRPNTSSWKPFCLAFWILFTSSFVFGGNGLPPRNRTTAPFGIPRAAPCPPGAIFSATHAS